MPSSRVFLSRSASVPSPSGDAVREREVEAAAWRAWEAEERLRKALRRQRERRGASEESLLEWCDRHPDESCVAHVVGNLCQSFLLSYGVRVRIGILLRAFKLARGQSYASLLDLKQLVSEKDLIVREEACCIGFFLVDLRARIMPLDACLGERERKSRLQMCTVAGLSILALDGSSRRRTLALHLLARLSQVMYAFVMRPETLPKTYRDFIQKTSPVAEPAYKAARDTCRGGPVGLVALSPYLCNKKGFGSIKLEEYASIIPCSMIHPDSDSCLAHNANVASTTFRKTFPLYFSLTFVTFVVLRLQKLKFCPVHAISCSWNALKAAMRSTTFLSAFVGIFQAVICLHKKVGSRDHKLLYWLDGGIAGTSVLLEKKNKRSELALYVFPRAGDLLWYILVNRHFLPDIKNAEVALFCLCMGGITYYLEYEPDTMAPFLRGLIRRFLASRISSPDPPAGHNSLYPYLRSDGSAKTESISLNKAGTETEATREQYNLESIPGL